MKEAYMPRILVQQGEGDKNMERVANMLDRAMTKGAYVWERERRKRRCKNDTRDVFVADGREFHRASKRKE